MGTVLEYELELVLVNRLVAEVRFELVGEVEAVTDGEATIGFGVIFSRDGLVDSCFELLSEVGHLASPKETGGDRLSVEGKRDDGRELWSFPPSSTSLS